MSSQINSTAYQPTREQQELSPEERDILWKLRFRRSLFIVSAWLCLSYVFVEGWCRVYPGNYLDAVRELFRFRMYPTWYLLGLFILLTIYFTRYFLQSAYPLFKDLKLGKKTIIYFEPGKYQTPFFAEYYMCLPSLKNPLLRIDKAMYDAIQPGCTARLALSVYSNFIFSVEVNGVTTTFNYPTAIDDL
jgi:hypothetical protein